MSDDLISRKAVIALIDELGYINVHNHDDFKLNCRVDKIRQGVVELATAFDKEMVIKELEYDKEMSKKHSTGLREQGHVEAFDEAIYVVKKGGIHNLLP